ncbi:MAG: hypothetical protein HY824_13560 [Acidobacteria bacterium]|nr:hypothetical protein [Acidobacteriota bacterium]
MDRRNLGRRQALGFAFSLIAPSLVVFDKYLGRIGVVAYVLAASAALVWVHRHFADRLAPLVTRRAAVGLAAAMAVALVVAFRVGYPLANSGWIGPGSDRDEHVNIGVTELLGGRYPYYQLAPYYESFISQMPGALILAVPFVLLGNGAYQNLFWIAAFVAALAWLLRDARPALVLTAAIFLFSPIVLNEYVVGGDLLANSLYVPLGALWVVAGRAAGRWPRGAAAAALGIALSSRPHFLLIAPLVFSALRAREGLRSAVAWMTVTGATFAAVTLPFYLHDPAAFSPLDTVGFLQPDGLPPAAGFLLAGICGAVAVGRALSRPQGDLRTFLASCTLVLAFPVLLSVLVTSIDRGGLDLSVAGYGLSFLFFGALAFMPSLSGAGRDRLGPSGADLTSVRW